MRVLLIEDDVACRAVVRAFLEADGHEVAVAADGEQGLRAFAQGGADLIVCDMFMPVKDGLEAIRDFRLCSPQVKILAISGGGRGGTLDVLPAALLVGADGVLYKPFAPDALASEIGRVMGDRP